MVVNFKNLNCMYCTVLLCSLVNQTPIPQRWMYCITNARKEGDSGHYSVASIGMSAEPMRLQKSHDAACLGRKNAFIAFERGTIIARRVFEGDWRERDDTEDGSTGSGCSY